VTCALQRGELMYGSISLARSTPGDWSQQVLADYRLIVATLASRMADQHAQLMLTDALSVGDQARAVQQQFFATVGHELRTPVSTIIGYAELLQEEAEAQPPGDFASGVAQDAGHVLSAAEHLLAVVEDLLGTGQVLGEEGSRVPVDVAAAVADVRHWHRVPAGRAQVALASTVEPGLQVLARPTGVRQVLTNLVGNAVAYNRPGGSVEVGAQPLVGEGGQQRVRVTVRDTGVGLDAEQLKRVFDPFVRFADPSVRGTGLGLPLARTVAERDGGSIGAESTPGQGSVFWLDLPVG
jgi:signal transduction histidine kinase